MKIFSCVSRGVVALAALLVFLAGPAVAAEPIRLGLPTTLSIFQGDEMLKAATLAVEEINAAGGVAVGGQSLPLELISADLRDALPGVPVPEALMGVEKMIMDGKVDALVVGPIRSEAFLPAMDIVAKHKIPLVETVAMTPGFQAKVKENPEKYKYIFRAGMDGRYMAGYIIGTLRHLQEEYGFTKMIAIIQDVVWARGTAEAVCGAMKKAGWDIVGIEAFPTGASDFSSALLKTKMSGAQVILDLFDMPTSGILVKQWAGMKIPALMVGDISPMAGPDAWKTYDGKIGGILNMVMESGNIAIPKIPASVEFLKAYEKRWGNVIQAPHSPSASYEAVYIVKEAMERAGTRDGDAVAAAIKNTDRKGVMGRVRFDEGNQAVFGEDPEETAIGCMFQWREGGQRVVVYPASVAEDKILLPDWMKSAK
ncbi:MAG: ABC transporter substrate-binding protein [Pseudomonadota bacterium]